MTLVHDERVIKRYVWTESNIRRYWHHVRASPMDDQAFSRRYAIDLYRLWRRYLQDPIVDVGAGAGYLSAHWATRGVFVHNEDPLWDEPELAEPVGTILLVDVYEHLLADQIAPLLGRLYARLRAAGRLLLCVPYREDLDRSCCICPSCESIFHRWQHQRSVECPMIVQDLVRAGFEIEWTWFCSTMAWAVGQRGGRLAGWMAEWMLAPDHLVISAWKAPLEDR